MHCDEVIIITNIQKGFLYRHRNIKELVSDSSEWKKRDKNTSNFLPK